MPIEDYIDQLEDITDNLGIIAGNIREKKEVYNSLFCVIRAAIYLKQQMEQNIS